MKKAPGDTRDAILAAAATAFAARGFSAHVGGQHRRRVRLQQGDDLLPLPEQEGPLRRDPPRRVPHAWAAAPPTIADADLDPAAKIEAFIDAFDDMAATRPYMPPMMMREMAEGAVHLDSDTLRLMAAIFEQPAAHPRRGRLEGRVPARRIRCSPTSRSSARSSSSARRLRFAPRSEGPHVPDVLAIDPATFVANVKSTAITALTAGAPGPRPSRPRRRRSRANRPGDHA